MMWKAIRAGAFARNRRRWRRLAEERRKGAWRLLGISILALGTAGLVLGAGVGAGLYVQWRSAELLAPLLVSALLLGIMSALLLSSIGHAVQSFFSAQDLWFWDASCAPPVSRFIDRFVETMVASVPAVASMGALALGGFVVASGFDVPTLLRAELALLLVMLLPVSVGVSVAHMGGALLPAGKFRRASLLLLTLASAGFLLWIRAARIERVVTEEGAQELLRSAEGLKQVGPAWLPSSVGARFALDGGVANGVVLLGTVMTAVLIAFILHRLLYARARDKASDDAPLGLAPTSRRARFLRWMAARLASSRTRTVVERDLLVFVRDPAQWSQLILLLGIGLIYLINAAALVEGFGGFGDASDVVLGALHTGLVCFISAGLAARFAFPAVSSEGPAFWFLEGAPLSEADYLDAKWRGAIPIVAGYPIVLGVVGAFALGLSSAAWVLTVALIVTTSLSLAAFGVGRGARAPVLDAINLSELAMGPGALSTMAIAIMISGTVSVSFAVIHGGAIGIARVFDGRPWWTSAVYLASIVVIGGVALAGRGAMRGGVTALIARKAEPDVAGQ